MASAASSSPKASAIAVWYGNWTENMRIENRTYATATSRRSGERRTSSKPARSWARTDVVAGRPCLSPSRPRCPRADPRRECCAKDDQPGDEQHEVLGADQRGQRTGRKRPDEPAGDGRARDQREEALRLASIECGRRNRPDQRQHDRVHDVDRDADDAEGDGCAAREREAEHHQRSGKGEQQPDEERPPRQLSQPDAVPQRHDQAHAAERDVEVRQVGGPEAAEEEGHVGDLTGPAGRLDGREQAGQESDRPALARPDGERRGSLHGLAGSGISSAACSNT